MVLIRPVTDCAPCKWCAPWGQRWSSLAWVGQHSNTCSISPKLICRNTVNLSLYSYLWPLRSWPCWASMKVAEGVRESGMHWSSGVMLQWVICLWTSAQTHLPFWKVLYHVSSIEFVLQSCSFQSHAHMAIEITLDLTNQLHLSPSLEPGGEGASPALQMHQV